MKQQYDLEIVCRECGVSVETLISWVNADLFTLPTEWDEELLDMVRRIRRLTTLGVNVTGVDMILHMRRQLIDQQERIRRFEQEMEQLRIAHEREIGRLMRRLAVEL
jgi:DNA-binding transcriptional MerR regulator